MSIEETNHDSTGRGTAVQKQPANTLNVHSAADQDFSYQNGIVIGFRQLGTMLRRNTILQVTRSIVSLYLYLSENNNIRLDLVTQRKRYGNPDAQTWN